MDHVVYTDAKEKELEGLIAGTKTMIIREQQVESCLMAE